MADFPIVPDVAGVPALIRDPLSAIASIELMTADLIAGIFPGVPQWGVYRDGAPMIVFDAFMGVEYEQDWAIANYPVERGAFESYDKVDTPFAVRARFASGGSVENRTALIASIDAIAGDLNLYDVVTPEAVYGSVNVERYNYRRSNDRGLGVLLVEMRLVEVRVEGISDFKNTKAPSGASPAQDGMVAPAPASSAQDAYAAGGIT